MKVTKFGVNNISFGLDWVRLPGEKLDNEISSAITERGINIGLVRKIADQYDIRSQIGLADDKAASGSYSAAALLASTEGSSIFVDKLSEEEYWVCAITEHEVIPGGDFVGSVETANDKINEIIGEFGPEAHEQLKLVVAKDASQDLELLGDESLSFEEFIFSNEALLSKDTRINRIRTVPKSAIYIAGLMILGGLLYFLFSGGDDDVSALNQMLPGDKPFAALERVNLPLGPSEDDILSAALMEEIKWLREDFENYEPNAVIEQVMNTYNQVPNYVAGWSASSLVFDVNVRRDKVSIVWDKGPIGTALTLSNATNLNNIAFKNGGSQATTSFNIGEWEKRRVGRDVLQYISDTVYTVDDLIGDVQMLGLNYSISQPSSSARPVPIEGLKNKSSTTKRQLNQRHKVFKLSGDNHSTLRSLTTIFGSGDSVLLKRLELSLRDSQWKITGEIYEK